MLLLLIVLLVVLIGAVVYVLMIQGAEAIGGSGGSATAPSQRLKPKRQKKRCELCGNRWSRFRMKCRGKLY